MTLEILGKGRLHDQVHVVGVRRESSLIYGCHRGKLKQTKTMSVPKEAYLARGLARKETRDRPVAASN